MGFLDLTHKTEIEKKNGVLNLTYLQSRIAAYQGKFNEAGNILLKGGYGEKAVELFTELKDWENAKKFAKLAEQNKVKIDGKDEQVHVKGQMSSLLKNQAAWVNEIGDWKAAAELYIASNEFRKVFFFN